MGLFGGDSKSEPKYSGPAHRAAAENLFLPGGIFYDLIFGGAPNAGLQRNIIRGQENLMGGLAQQGLTGSGLAAKALTNFNTQAVGQQQDAIMQLAANVFRPTGVSSSSSSGTFGI